MKNNLSRRININFWTKIFNALLITLGLITINLVENIPTWQKSETVFIAIELPQAETYLNQYNLRVLK